MKALVLCGDFYHPGGIVEDGLSYLKPEWDLSFITDMAQMDLHRASLDDFNVIVLCKDDQISPINLNGWLDDSIAQKFTDYTEAGGGFVVMHAGTVACKRSGTLKKLTGCEFMCHPEQCPVEYAPIPGVNDSVTNGVFAFTEKDEHYSIEISAEDIDIFLEGKSEHYKVAAGYTRTQGKGRVLVLTPGHNLPVWQNGEYRKIVKNALYWCAKKI